MVKQQADPRSVPHAARQLDARAELDGAAQAAPAGRGIVEAGRPLGSEQDRAVTYADLQVSAFTALVSLILCLRNTYWDLPMVDFRPFKVGTNVRERKALEEEARGNIEITGWIFENTNTGEVVTVMNPEYSAAAASYPKEQGWKVKDRVQSEHRPLVDRRRRRCIHRSAHIE